MEMNYTPIIDPKTGEQVGYEKPTLLYKYPSITSSQIAIIVISVFIIAMLGVMTNIIIQRSNMKVRTIKSVKRG